MKNIILIIAIVSLSGCGIFRKTKDKNKTTTQVDIVKEETTTTTEKVDTVITVEGDSAKLSVPLDELKEKGEISATNGKTTVKVSYDKKTGNITATGITDKQDIPVVIDRTTTTKSKLTDQSKIKSNTSSMKKERETSSGFGWGFVVAILLLIALISLLFYTNRRN